MFMLSTSHNNTTYYKIVYTRYLYNMRVPGWEGIMLDLRDQLLPFLRCSFQDASFAQCQLDPELNPVVPSFTIMLGFVAYSYIVSVYSFAMP